MTWKTLILIERIAWVNTQVLFLLSALVCGFRAFHDGHGDLRQIFFSVQAILFAIWSNQLHAAFIRRASLALPLTAVRSADGRRLHRR